MFSSIINDNNDITVIWFQLELPNFSIDVHNDHQSVQSVADKLLFAALQKSFIQEYCYCSHCSFWFCW